MISLDKETEMINQSQLINFRTDQSISPVKIDEAGAKTGQPESTNTATRTMREYKIHKLTSNKRLIDKASVVGVVHKDSQKQLGVDAQKLMSSSSSNGILE